METSPKIRTIRCALVDTVGILGSGFGLYGYLPAFANLGYRVLLPFRYTESLRRRNELQYTLKKVEFCSEREIYSGSNQIVIARNPARQLSFIQDFERLSTRLWLEKPLAPSRAQHQDLLHTLTYRKTLFSIGYLFPFTSWWPIVQEHLGTQSTKVLEIDWKIIMRNGWKVKEIEGGGLVAFYGIHLSPLVNIKDLTREGVSLFEGKDKIQYEFISILGGRLIVRISYHNHNSFRVGFSDSHKSIFEGESPFGTTANQGRLDPRIPFLTEYISRMSRDYDQESVLAQESFAIFLRSLSRGHCPL